MNSETKHKAVSKAITSQEKNGKKIAVYDNDTPQEVKNALLEIQRNLDAEFELSYEIMADACDIIAEKTLTGNDRDSLVGDDLDFMSDADNNANVYTNVQLSYLSNHNEAEISALMKDEAIDSIAQACSIWYSQKVAEACEALKAYILA